MDLTRQTYGDVWFDKSTIRHRIFEYSDSIESKFPSLIKLELGVDISYPKAFRAKQLALEVIHGTHEDVYKAMSKYCTDVEQTNPNSVVHLDVTSENFWCRAKNWAIFAISIQSG